LPVSGARQTAATRTSPLDSVRPVRPTELAPRATLTAADETAPIIIDFDTGGDSEPTLEEYIERIEQSAARLRAERAGEVRAIATPTIRKRPERAETAAPRRSAARRKGDPRRRKAAAKPKKPWYRRRRTWVMVALVLPLLFVVAASAYVLNIVRVGIDAYGDINEPKVERDYWRVNAEGTPEPVPSSEVEAVMPDWGNDDPINIVLLGVDARDGEELPPRSDTTIVAQIDPKTHGVTMMSIPRDLIVYIPGFGEDKFNAAYPIGEANADEIEGGGTTLVATTIEANFNIPIHYYVTIDFDGFEKVVDTVGGVTIDVPYELSDNQYPTDDLRLTRIYFPAGLQKMDGKRALQYVRTRHADSDFGRSERQQQVLMAIREQAHLLDLFRNATSLIDDMRDTIRTDLVFNEMLSLANLGRNVKAEDIVRFNLWEEGLLTEHNDADAYYLTADWPAVLDRTRAVFGEGIPPPSDSAERVDLDSEPNLSTTVFVENATDIPLLAGNSAQILVDAGFEEVWPTDAREAHEFSVIEAPDTEMATARHIADLLGLSPSAIVPGGTADEITVILGQDVPEGLLPRSDQVSR